VWTANPTGAYCYEINTDGSFEPVLEIEDTRLSGSMILIDGKLYLPSTDGLVEIDFH